MIASMFKEALPCGLGMVIDLSGSSFTHSKIPTVLANDGITSDWKQVGSFLQVSIDDERPIIEAQKAKQLSLNLG
jgi:hypothetical protein